jgi:hypothetical protein
MLEILCSILSMCTRRDGHRAPKASHRRRPPALIQRHNVQAEISQIRGTPGSVINYCFLAETCRSKHWYSYNAVVWPCWPAKTKGCGSSSIFSQGRVTEITTRERKSSRHEKLRQCILDELIEIVVPSDRGIDGTTQVCDGFLPSTQPSIPTIYRKVYDSVSGVQCREER